MKAQKRRPSQSTMDAPIPVRIYENQRRYYGDFEPHKKTPWTLVLTNESCNSLEDFELPGSGEWCWISNWKIDMAAVETDTFGWEYASKLRRFQVPNRTHKPQPYSADRARRRRWVRFMSRSDCVASALARMRSVSTSGQLQVDFEALVPRIQNSLARVHSTRTQVEALMASADTSSSGPPSYTNEVQSFLLPLQVHIQEVLGAFESLEKQQEPPPVVAGVLKKLRNDVIKEQAALLKLLNPHRAVPEAAPSLESQANGLRRVENMSNRGSFSSNPFAPDASSNSSSMNSNLLRATMMGDPYDGGSLSARQSLLGRASEMENALLYDSTATRRRASFGEEEASQASVSTALSGRQENKVVNRQSEASHNNLRSIPESAEFRSEDSHEKKTTNRLSLNKKDINAAMATSVFSPAPPLVNESRSAAIPADDVGRASLSSYSSGWGAGPTAVVGSSSSSAAAVRSGNASTFNPALLLATAQAPASNLTGLPTDGMFVQRTAEEQKIDARLQRVDSAEVEGRIVDERATEILQIQKGLVLVNEMFSDMSRLILDQQEHVDTLYNESENTHASTQQALNHLMRANQTQKHSSCIVS